MASGTVAARASIAVNESAASIAPAFSVALIGVVVVSFAAIANPQRS